MGFAFWDYVVMAAYVAMMVAVAIWAKRRGQESLEDYFTGGKNLPWWLIGISMVATTFAADTPLAVTGIVASQGLGGNWIWWNFMFSGLFTVFLYAKLWRRADVITDVEFIELRYSGTPAKILRVFRALYLAFPINCIILGWVTVGMAKLLTVVTGADQWTIIFIIYGLTGLYIALSGLWGVVVTDFIQFGIALGGSTLLAFYAVDHVGGLSELQLKLTEQFGAGHNLLDFSPFNNPEIAITTALVWVGMMWWASWYPGSEPGGGGYIAQRMFSAKDEQHAVGGTLLFNVLHFAVRPWPWILVALASLIMYPNLSDKELGYPMLMMELLPVGLLGLLAVAFLSAFVSTVSTHLNWGASYVVNDVYKRFIKPPEEFTSEDQAEKHYVWISRWATLLMMVVAVIISYFFDTVKSGWEAILSIGAGTGLVYMLRWYWWRINAWSEIAAMAAAAVGSFAFPALGFEGFGPSMIATTLFATVAWLVVTFLTRPVERQTLVSFYERVRPGGPGWRAVEPTAGAIGMQKALASIVASAVAINATLWGMGQLFFGSLALGLLAVGVSVVLLVGVVRSL